MRVLSGAVKQHEQKRQSENSRENTKRIEAPRRITCAVFQGFDLELFPAEDPAACGP